MRITLQIGPENPILRKVSSPVKGNEMHTIRALSEAMVRYVKNPKNGGIGLAAPQTGINKRVIVVGLPKKYEDNTYPFVLMINPEIHEFSAEKEVGEEGCLSLPGLRGNVERSRWVDVSWNDIKGLKMRKRIDGYGAKVVQHEIDHLNGILISDKFLK